MNISWLKKNVIQIGVSVYSGSSLEHFKRCIQSCLAQDDVDGFLQFEQMELSQKT